MYKTILSIFLVAFATLISADITITFPATDTWLIAEITQTVQWTYNLPVAAKFSMYLNNHNKSIGIINYALTTDVLTADKSANISISIAVPDYNRTDYFITFTDIGNISNIYATSGDFEIKPNGSAPYSSQTPSASASASSSTNSSSPTSSSTPKSKSGGANLSFDTQSGSFLMLCCFVTFMLVIQN